MLIREKIKLLRQSRHWSQEYLAEKLGMSANSYGELERGKTKITFEKLEILARLFDIPLAEFCNEDATNVFIAHNTWTLYHSQQNNLCPPDENVKSQHELEKAQMMIEKLETIIHAQQNEITYLKEIITLMRRTS
jgi:transcriptional regulator with XRE-family HTH domain